MNINPVIWFEIYVQDMERAKRFYESVFAVKLQKLNAPVPSLELWAFPMEEKSVGAGGALVKMEGAPSGPGGSLIYFHTEDCAVHAEKIAKSGGRIHQAKTSLGEYGFMALAYDTEGNMIGLHSMS